jgi:Zn-dependent protease
VIAGGLAFVMFLGLLHGLAGELVLYLFGMNLVLFLFNLVPAFPMDGGRVLRAFVWARRRDRGAATRIAARLGIAFALLFIVAGVLVAAALHNALYGWYAVLGAFLLRTVWAQARGARDDDARRNVEVVPAA